MTISALLTELLPILRGQQSGDDPELLARVEHAIKVFDNQQPVAWDYRDTDMGNQLSYQCLNHYWYRKYTDKEHDYVKGIPLYYAVSLPEGD